MTDYYSSLERIKDYTQVDANDLGMESQDQWDTLLETLLRSAKGQIDAFCRRDFELHEQETLTLDGHTGDRKMLHLPYPVHEIHSLTEGDTTRTDGEDFEWKESGILIKTKRKSSQTRYATGSATYGRNIPPGLKSKRDETWEAGYNNIEVTLTYGYHQVPDAPDSWPTETPAIPIDVVEAEMELVDNTLQGLLSKRENTTIQTDDFTVEPNMPVSLTEGVKQKLRVHQVKELRG